MKKLFLLALYSMPFFVSAQTLNFNEMAKKCAKGISEHTMQAIARTESSFNPYAIGVVAGALKRQPANKAEAILAVQQLRRLGRNFSMGLVQVNVKNMAKYGLTDETVFDACENLRVGGAILQDCFRRATGDAQTRLQKALSCYYSGNFVRGFSGRDNYVARVVNNAKKNTPNQTIRLPENRGLMKVSNRVPAIDTRVAVPNVAAKKTVRKKVTNASVTVSVSEKTPKLEEKKTKQRWDVFGEF